MTMHISSHVNTHPSKFAEFQLHFQKVISVSNCETTQTKQLNTSLSKHVVPVTAEYTAVGDVPLAAEYTADISLDVTATEGSAGVTAVKDLAAQVNNSLRKGCDC